MGNQSAGRVHAPDEVVIVDDEPDILDVLADLVRDEGYVPRVFRDGANALAYMSLHSPALVLTDLHLPRMNGREFIARVRDACGPDLPIVVVSATADPELARSLAVQDVLSKPFDLDEFAALLRRWVRGGGERLTTEDAEDTEEG